MVKCLFIQLLFVVVACGFTLHADAPVFSVSIDPTPTDNFREAKFSMVIYDEVTEPRYILVLLRGQNGDGDKYLTKSSYKKWRNLAKNTNGVLLATTFKDRASEGFSWYYKAEDGSGAALETAINLLDDQDTRYSVKDLPLLIYGHSAGGAFGYGYSCYNPDRVIGWASTKGGYYEGTPRQQTYHVPALMVSGMKDLGYRRSRIRSLFQNAREKNAPWCWMEDGENHGEHLTFSAIKPFFNGLLSLRLEDHNNTPIALSLDSGLMVDLPTQAIMSNRHYENGVRRQGWLPTNEAYDAWKLQDVGMDKYQVQSRWNSYGGTYSPAPPPNEIPIANAGGDQNLIDQDHDSGELVALSGNLSTDNDGTIVSYLWEEGASILSTEQNAEISLSVGSHLITLTVTDNNGATATDDVQVVIEEGNPLSAPKLSHGTLNSVTSQWQKVTLPTSYQSMVVVATPQYNLSSMPLVTRIRNATGNSFEVKVQNPSENTTFDAIPVKYIVLEEGVYDKSVNGVKMEAVKYLSKRTDNKGNFVGEEYNYANNYNNPVVLGQVMTNHDNWSTFWARGVDKKKKPSSNTLFTGKSVGEDINITRADETIGFIVIESGISILDGSNIQAGVTGKKAENPTINFHTSSLNVGTVVLSPAGLIGNNGGWPVIPASPEANSFSIFFDEDQIADIEREHLPERVSFLVIESL